MSNPVWVWMSANVPRRDAVLADIRRYGIGKFTMRAIRWLFAQKILLVDVLWELAFDSKYKVSTSRIVRTEDLGYGDTEQQQRAIAYIPVPAYRLRKALNALNRYQVDIRSSTFVDYGCGAGRAMILAAEAGFQAVIGIELSPHLVSLCQKNIARYQGSTTNGPQMTVRLQNAVDFVPHLEDNVFFFFKPFDRDTYQQVAVKIQASLASDPRTGYLLDMWSGFNFVGYGWKWVARIASVDIYAHHPGEAGSEIRAGTIPLNSLAHSG